MLIQCDVVLCAADISRQSQSSQMEETDFAEDRTGGQRRDMSTSRSSGTAGEVRGVTVA